MRLAFTTLTLLLGQLFADTAERRRLGADASRLFGGASGRMTTTLDAVPPQNALPLDYADAPSSGYGVASGLPRKFQCYSCMSLSYQNNWERLQHLYVQPKIFTDRCEHPADFDKMPTVECSSVCVSMVEADVDGGVFLGFKYIRGCINRILMHDFNLSALRTHRFTQADLCRSLPRTVLFNNPRTAPQVFGEVNLCTCFGDRCNAASQSSKATLRPNFLALFIALIFSSCLFRLV